MDRTTSADGTVIAYEQRGGGRPLIVVGGAFQDRAALRPLAQRLPGGHAVVVYDRRGRGASDDRAPGARGAVVREVEDLAALVAAVGQEPAALVGHSSGAVLALAAAERGLPVSCLVLLEPPFATAAFPASTSKDLPDRLAELVRAGHAAEAVALFQTEAVGLPPETVAEIRRSPLWPQLEALAPSLVYDAVLTRDYPHPTAFTSVTAPTLVLSGDNTWPRLAAAAAATAEALPHAEHRVVAGRDHDVDPAAVATAVHDFLETR